MMGKNEHTPFIRQCIALWLAQNAYHSFSVPSVVTDLIQTYSGLQGIDITKAVSNEMIRLEKLGNFTSRQGSTVEDGCGIGRPPLIYTKRFCNEWKKFK